MTATVCPPREVLLAFHTGELPEAAVEAVIAHLGRCPACQVIVDAFGESEDGLVAALRRQGAYTAEPQFRELVERAKALVSPGDAQKAPPGHPTKEQLAAYAWGKLAESAAGPVAKHVEQCPDCEATLSNMSADAGTSLGKRPGTAKPQPNDLPPTELFASPPASPRTPPSQLREYRILEKLGQGGMGTVYKALHTKLDKLVALKVLPAVAMQDAELVARFEREMKAVGKLEHPNIVRAMDAGCHEGTHFLVMEYIDGMDLAEIVKRCGPLRVADACEVIRQAALGLRHADEHALVHRDIKPSNMVLSPEGEVKILDLGLALLQTERMAGENATSQGRAMGTVDYMAPEQARDSHLVDIRADIYGLGCSLYKLLTGRAPYSGPEYKSSFDKLMAHVSQPFPAIRQSRPDVPEKLAAVLEVMVAKDRELRYMRPREVVEDLKPFCSGSDLAGLLMQARKQVKDGAPAASLPTPGPAGKAQTQNIPEPFGRGAGGEGRGEGRPIGRAEGEVRRPAPSAPPASSAPPAPGAPPATPPAAKAAAAALGSDRSALDADRPPLVAGLLTPPNQPPALGAGLPTPPNRPTARPPSAPPTEEDERETFRRLFGDITAPSPLRPHVP